MVGSRSMVRGPSPGPALAFQALASNWRLTRSSWRTWPHRKLRRKVPRVDGALTVPPRRCARHRSRRCSRRRPEPAPVKTGGGGHQRHQLVAGVGPAWAAPQAEVPVHQLGQAQMLGQGGRKDQTGVGHQAVVVEGDPEAVGTVAKRCSFSGVGFLFQNHYPRFRGAPFHRFRPLTPRFPSVDSGLTVELQATL